ncbi:hypothetical protein PR048_033349 [Dryococelus australis]|uniref:Small subunit processome component 20 homolog n=1 Tax=Dryococelus australis TaxID=614101 RepID=A0ABQ9G351_9NEOP|nr:hypothetical protein PR048_033349 [Dryococelus australis]
MAAIKSQFQSDFVATNYDRMSTFQMANRDDNYRMTEILRAYGTQFHTWTCAVDQNARVVIRKLPIETPIEDISSTDEWVDRLCNAIAASDLGIRPIPAMRYPVVYNAQGNMPARTAHNHQMKHKKPHKQRVRNSGKSISAWTHVSQVAASRKLPSDQIMHSHAPRRLPIKIDHLQNTQTKTAQYLHISLYTTYPFLATMYRARWRSGNSLDSLIILEYPGSIPSLAILILVFQNHSRRMLGWVPSKGHGRFLSNHSPIPLPCATCTICNEVAVNETLSPLAYLPSCHHFQPFSERISNINIDVFHRVGHKYEEASEEEEGTYVHRCLQKWNVLNLSESYEELRKGFPFVLTLPQLLNKKDEVLALLLKFARLQNPLSLQPVLDLIVAFARDLHHDFYPFYGDVLECLVGLLNTKDTEQLEWTFTCLAHLFKFLWRCLTKDVTLVFDSLVPLLSGSWPAYINNFAAEGFAFVARKVRDKRQFLLLILRTLQERPDCVMGCGRLLFEVVRGVSGQFHNCAETVLPLYLRSLADEEVPTDVLSAVLEHIVACVCSEVKPKKCGILWACISDALDQFVGEERQDAVLSVLQLVRQLVGCKQGLYVCEPEQLAQRLSRLLGAGESIAMLTTEVAAALLQSYHVQLQQEHASLLTLKILALPHKEVLLSFFQSVFDYSSFESLVLPRLLAYCRDSSAGAQTVDGEILHLLARLVLHKSPLSASGLELGRWRQYLLNFAVDSDRVKQNFPLLLLKVIDVEDTNDLLSKVESCLCVLICLPHVKPLPKKIAVKAVENVIKIGIESLKRMAEERSTAPGELLPGQGSETKNKLTFLFNVAMDTLVHLEDAEDLLSVLDFDSVINVSFTYAADAENLCMLRTLDLYLSSLRMQNAGVFTADLFSKLLEHLNSNIVSPYHPMRLLTLHILSLFETPGGGGCGLKDWSLFNVCLAAESTPATVQDYREKLQHVNKLSFEFTRDDLLRNPLCSKVPFQFLLGILYVNFQLLWEPVTKLVASYARGMPPSDFWEVFLQQLSSSAEHVTTVVEDSPHTSNCLEWDVLVEVYNKFQTITDKPDHVNYRILLWKTLAEFSDVSEPRNREFVPLFITYLENEYFKSNADLASRWNIKQNSSNTGHEEDEAEEMEQDVEDGELATIKQRLLVKPAPLPFRFNSRSGHRTLLAHMSIFTKIKNPKGLFREPELFKIFNDFLSHKNPDVQKMALDFVMAYRDKRVTPYQEHLYALIDDKTFKNEITMFRVESEGQVIQEDDRPTVMPFILRIVYGKMLGKSTVHSRGKAGGQWKRSLVLRFLAGCREEEMITFAEMTFKLFAQYIQDDPVALVENIASTLNLERVIPPKRLQSSVNMLHVVLEQLGSLMGPRLQPYLLRVLLCIGAFVSEVLNYREQIHAGYLSNFRTLRNSCLEAVAKFFSHFEEYRWSEVEVDAVFHVLVWPWLEKLPSEGMYSPTALLKLFATWSSNPRYFILLAKHRDGQTSYSPLPYIIQLLRGKKTHVSVVKFIMDMLKNMLTLQESEEHTGIAPIAVNAVLVTSSEEVEKLALLEELNLGSRLLLPHIGTIMEHLQNRLGSSRKKGLGHQELVVLSRVSELVCDRESCGQLVDLLLPVLSRRAGAGEQVVYDMVSSLMHLLPRVHQPEKYLRLLAPLFGTVSHVGPRKLLCKILEQVSVSASPDYREQATLTAELVAGMNAWNARWVEQPDFDRRLDTFKKISALLGDNHIGAELGTLIIYNCFYFLKKETDLSLRDTAGLCLRKVAPALCNRFKDNAEVREFLVDHTVLLLVRAGIRDKNETVRYEAVALLGEMARECGDLHPVLRDLSKLANKLDPEVDFFENLQHLQSHRKTRALLKFCSVAASLDKPPNPRTLTQFILPLASCFLLSEKYATKNSIVDAAIQTVGTVCRLLPWHQYETILRYYLTKLRTSVEYQKQLVRIVVAVLDSFHYNLSRAQVMEGKHGLIVTQSVQPQTKADSTADKTDLEGHTEQELITEELTDEEKLDSALEESSQGDGNVDVEGTEKVDAGKPQEPAITRQTVLARSTAGRVIQVITSGLLPQLQRCMAQRTQVDKAHKVNRKYAGPDRDEEDILRVPVTLAVVKLLQRLPSYMMDNYLPGVIMKLCTFLKSRMDSIRRITRETLQKIVVTLGPRYLGMVVREMTSLLTKGFQVHVLVFTMHAVLVALKSMFTRGDVDSCLQDVLEVCKKDLFGAVAEEKDVAQIVNKTHEAKSAKSYDMFSILAQYISENCFTDLLMPLKQVLSSSFSHKVVSKVSECLRHIVAGLTENTFVSVESVVIFMYGVTSETIPELSMETRQAGPVTQKGKLLVQRPDSYIIPLAPRSRYGALNTTAKNSAQTNAHILVEFGLQLLYTLLKKEKLRSGDFKAHIDPIVPILCRCLEGKHVKLTMLSLQCFRWVLKMDLPSMRMNVSKVADSLFTILHKYAVAGLSKGDNFTLAVTVLVRDSKYHCISTDQLKTLLLYAEQDIHDYSRQATAFSLLKAILARKLVAPEIHDVMKKVGTLSITSELAHIRLQARQVFHQFLMDYPISKKLDLHLSFYISQLNYELQPGRESALEMIQTIINSFPLPVLNKQSGLFFVTIGARLMNDDAPECRKRVAQCIKSMLLRISKNERDKLFDIVLLWLEDRKVSHRQLAAQLCGLFVEAEKESFETRLSVVVPALLGQFGGGIGSSEPGRYVRVVPVMANPEKTQEGERMRDHLLFQALKSFIKICEHCPVFLRHPDWMEYINQLADSAESFLAYSHEWVRLAAAQLLGHVFSSLDPDAVAAAVAQPSREMGGYLMRQTSGKVRSLVLDLCAVLQLDSMAPELVDQVIKNLVFLGRVLKDVMVNQEDSSVKVKESHMVAAEDEMELNTKVSLPWMIRQLRRVMNKEVIHNPKSERSAMFKWLGAMAVTLERDHLGSLLPCLMPPLVRELTTEAEAQSSLRRLAKEVADVVKRRVGAEQYTLHLSRLQNRLAVRRLERKKMRTQEVITDPERAAKRKIQKQLKKKVDKKKKMEILKGRKPGKRKPKKAIEIDET